MRRCFFRLMLADLNTILEGLTELEDRGVATIDCRRAQFSAQEPISRLRIICQSWKVMFQAEYSSGQPLRMLVDLRASVDQALGRGKAADPKAESDPKAGAPSATKAESPKKKSLASAAAAGLSEASGRGAAVRGSAAEADTAISDAPEFEVSSTPGWDSDSDSQPGKKG
jgi:hypothetical protein